MEINEPNGQLFQEEVRNYTVLKFGNKKDIIVF